MTKTNPEAITTTMTSASQHATRTGGKPGFHHDDSREIALAALSAALEKKAFEPVLIDVRDLASYTDYILVLSGRSDRQVTAISDGIIEALLQENHRPLGIEGKEGQWTLVDFGDLVVHVFYHPTREFYDLEGLWSDAPRVPIEVPGEARLQVDEMY